MASRDGRLIIALRMLAVMVFITAAPATWAGDTLWVRLEARKKRTNLPKDPAGRRRELRLFRALQQQGIDTANIKHYLRINTCSGWGGKGGGETYRTYVIPTRDSVQAASVIRIAGTKHYRNFSISPGRR